MDPADSAIDASEVLWRFVEAVLAMPYDSITMTPEFEWLADAHEHGASFVLREDAFLPWELASDALLNQSSVFVPCGVAFDLERRRYELADIDALFAGLGEIAKAALLLPCFEGGVLMARMDAYKRCINKMEGVLQVHALASEMDLLFSK